MRTRNLAAGGAIALFAALFLNLVTPRPAEAFIHEIIAAMCRAGGEEVQPPAQSSPDSKAFIRALMATGFITSIDSSDPTKVVIHFDPTIPASKFKSAGHDEVIPNGAGPGVALVLSPLVVPDPDFAAHANCHNLNP